MKSSTIKLKLEKKVVIKKLQDKLKSMQKEHENLVKKFNKEEEAWQKWMHEVLKKCKSLKLSDINVYHSEVRLTFEMNKSDIIDFERNTDKRDVKRSEEKMEYLEKQIQLLEMCIDETVPMSMVDDIVNYL